MFLWTNADLQGSAFTKLPSLCCTKAQWLPRSVITNFLYELWSPDCVYLKHNVKKECWLSRSLWWVISNVCYECQDGQGWHFMYLPSQTYINKHLKIKSMYYWPCYWPEWMLLFLSCFFFLFLKMWTISKSCICLVYWLWGTCDLSCPSRNQTSTLCIGRWSLNHWTVREVPMWLYIVSNSYSLARVQPQWIQDNSKRRQSRHPRKELI